MKAVHFGITPGVITSAIVTALKTLTPVKSVERIENDDEESIKRGLTRTKGAPALLLMYGGGTFQGDSTDEQTYDDTLAYTVYCVACRPSTADDRFSGGEYDSDLATDPGVEELQDWALYLAVRAAHAAGARQVLAVRHSQAFELTAGRWMGTVEFTARRRLDLYDDDVSTTLQEIGIVKNPSSPPDLFEVDNTTPKSDEPPDTAGGVFDL